MTPGRRSPGSSLARARFDNHSAWQGLDFRDAALAPGRPSRHRPPPTARPGPAPRPLAVAPAKVEISRKPGPAIGLTKGLAPSRPVRAREKCAAAAPWTV